MNGHATNGTKLDDLVVEPKLPDVDVERQDGGLLGQVNDHPPKPPVHNLAYLDGLRGLAAFAVYWGHHNSWFLGPEDEIHNGFGHEGGSHYFATLPFVRVFWTGGHAAVCLFFVLSGYVLSRSPLRAIRDGRKPYQSLISAVIRRPARLFIPPMAVSFIMAICLQLPFRPLLTWPPPQSNIFTEIASWCVDVVKALDPFMNHGIASSWFKYDPPVWTMSHEFNGSMLVYFMVAAGSLIHVKLRVIIYSFVGIVFLMCKSWTMACFMGGMVLSSNDVEELDTSYLNLMTPPQKTGLFHVLFFSGWYLLSMVQGDSFNSDPGKSENIFGWYYITKMTPNIYYTGEYWRFWHSIGAVLVVYAILRIRWLQQALTGLKYLGKVSFILYLSHIPFLWVFGDRIYRFFGFVRKESADLKSIFDNVMPIPNIGPKGLTLQWLVCQSVIFSLNMVLAHYGTIWIDEPSVTAGKWLSKKILGK